MRHSDICIPVFIAALLTIAKSWKQPKCTLMDDRRSKMWYLHTKEYYSALKRGKCCHIFNMDELEDITPSEMSQWQNEMYDSFEVPRIVKFIEIESRILVSMGLEGVGRNEELVFNSTEFQSGMMTKVLEVDGDDDCKTTWMYLMLTELFV